MFTRFNQHQAFQAPALQLREFGMKLSPDDLRVATDHISTPTGIAEDVFVNVGNLSTFRPIDMLVVEYDATLESRLILGRPFLRTASALIDVHGEEMTLT
ncbi:reverse transcriptase domain-containing protein [Tanacetum coccineum]